MWVQLLVWVVTSLISAALSPKPEKPKPGTLKGIPLAGQGDPIPVLFGKRILKTPNCVWWGDLRTVPIKAKEGKK